MKKETINTEGMSLSKQRKLKREAEIAQMKKAARNRKIALAVTVLVFVGLVIWAIAAVAISKANQVTASSNYSAQINDNGLIKNVTATKYVTVADYKNITAPLSEIEYTDAQVEEDITNVLNENKVLSDSKSLVAATGDTVSLDYTGYVDGEAIENGSATAAEVELGSGTLIDTFEDQIVGHVPGDEFTVEVTFPDDYTQNETLAGKAATFTVKLNSIYTTPAFTDEFVAEHLSEYASTAAEYRQYLKDTNYEKNLISYVQEYLINNSTLKSYPSAYTKQLKSNYKAEAYAQYEYMNSLYSYYTGSAMYADFAAYLSKNYSMTEKQYDISLKEQVTDELKYALICQAIAEKEGITASADEAKAYFIAQGTTEETVNSDMNTYGTGYVVQMYLYDKIIKGICETVTVQ